MLLRGGWCRLPLEVCAKVALGEAVAARLVNLEANLAEHVHAVARRTRLDERPVEEVAVVRHVNGRLDLDSQKTV